MLRDNWDSFTTEKAATTIGGKAEQDKWDFNSILIGLTATQYTISASLQSGINDWKFRFSYVWTNNSAC